jgi:hypothetical protein
MKQERDTPCCRTVVRNDIFRFFKVKIRFFFKPKAQLPKSLKFLGSLIINELSYFLFLNAMKYYTNAIDIN